MVDKWLGIEKCISAYGHCGFGEVAKRLRSWRPETYGGLNESTIRGWYPKGTKKPTLNGVTQEVVDRVMEAGRAAALATSTVQGSTGHPPR